MKALRITDETYRLDVGTEELTILLFLTKFFMTLDKTVFTGKFMRRVRRIHSALEEVQ